MLLYVVYFICSSAVMVIFISSYKIQNFLEVMKLWNFLQVIENLITKLISSLLDDSKYDYANCVLK